jgi:ligand-binding sensor domain-containing protein
MVHVRILLCAFLSLTCRSMQAQKPFYTSAQTFTGKDGYRVFVQPHYITQDNKGLLWIGSDNGLYAFDGIHFKNYRRRKGDSTGLPSNYILFNYQDRRGLYWVYVHGQGLYRFHPNTQSFAPFRYRNQTTFNINRFRLALPFETKSGELWFPLAGYGLARWDAEKDSMIPYRICPEGNCGGYDKASWVWDITQDPDDGSFWLGTNGGLVHYNSITGKQAVYLDSTTLPMTAYGHFFWDREKTLWLGTWGGGLKKFDRRTKKFSSYRWANELIGTKNIVNGIGHLDDRYLWVATGETGLLVFDKKEEQFLTIKSLADEKKSFASLALFQNAAGVMWVASREELHRFHLSENKFQYTSLQKLIQPSTGFVNSFVKKDSILYTGMYYDGKSLMAVNETTGDQKIYTDRSLSGIRFVSEAADGTIWIATSNGIYFFDPRSKKFTKGGRQCKSLDSLRANEILHSADGSIWLACNSGLARYFPSQRRLEWIRHSLLQIASGYFYSLYQDKEGNLWFGNGQDGLGCYRPSGEIVMFNATRNNQYPSGKCLSITQARTGEILFSVETQGLGVLSNPFAANEAIDLLGLEDGLPGEGISCILKDADGRCWLATNGGLSLFDAEKKTFRNFSRSHGLIDNFLDSKLYQAVDGAIYLGFENGYQRFYPEQLLQAKKEEGFVHLSSLKVNGKETVWDTNGQLSLHHQQTNIAFSFAFLTKNHTPGYRLFYKLDGIDADWVAADEKASAQYNSLAPGRYRFHVKAINQQGTQQSQAFLLPLRIASPWYESWWFYTLLALVVAGTILTFYRYRIHSIHQQNTLKQNFHKKLNETEMRALRAQMNPHFIFNCLNSINRYIVKSDNKTASSYLTKFSKLIRLILDNSASDTIALDREIQTLQLYLDMEALRFDHAFTYEINYHEIEDTESIIIPSMLLQPYVENAIWHGLLNKTEGEGKIWIYFKQLSPYLLLAEIRDNGVGRKKAKELSSSDPSLRKKSYGIQISRERLQLANELYNHKGSVEIIDLEQDTEPTGTCVLVKIPLQSQPESFTSIPGL